MVSLTSRLSLTKYQRIQMYLKSLKMNVEIKNNSDKLAVKKIESIINNKIIHIKRMTYILYFFYAGIYFSFISLFTQNFLFLSEITSILGLIVSFFGTTIFFLGAFVSNSILELYYQDLNLLTSHIIAIYLSNETTSDSTLSDNNSYNRFIDFFSERGFIDSKLEN